MASRTPLEATLFGSSLTLLSLRSGSSITNMSGGFEFFRVIKSRSISEVGLLRANFDNSEHRFCLSIVGSSIVGLNVGACPTIETFFDK